MASRKSRAKRKAAQEAAKKRNIINTGIVLVVVLAVIWIASSAKQKTVSPESPPEAAQPVATQMEDTENVDAPSASDAPTERPAKNYDSAPPMSIETDVIYLATVKMANGGEFVIELYPDKAPITVNSFIFLAREGYFDETTFHRVLEGFMAQGGDPTGTGMGGPGYEFVNEDSDLTFDKAGVVAMANAGRDTNGSQFFITFLPVPQLNGGYTIFGQVIEGMDIVNGITRRDPQQYPDFEGDMIESITISEK